VVLFGRERELAELRALAHPDGQGPRALVVLGDVGSGKSALAAECARFARAAGRHVVELRGRESETRIPSAALTQLLRALQAEIADTGTSPHSGIEAQLLGAPSGEKVLAVGLTVLSLVERAGEARPGLIVVDDAHLVDAASLEILSFVFQRVSPAKSTLLLTADGIAMPDGFERTFPELHLEPLDDADSLRVLDSAALPLNSRERIQILEHAAGNPLALIELGRALAADPGAGRSWPHEPLPIGAHLSRRIMRRVAALPAEARFALLVAAVEGSSGAIPGGVFGTDLAALGPAERAGLVAIDRGGVRFSHPFVRSAVYHAASFSDRADAHRALADAFADRPQARAWHLAAIAREPDERLASMLAESGAESLRLGDSSRAGDALERAAELSPHQDEQARRFLSAARIVASTGDGARAESIAARAWAAATTLEVRVSARLALAWVLASRGDFAAATRLLAAAAAASSRSRHTGELGWNVLGIAAAVGYQSGSSRARELVGNAAARLARTAPSGQDLPAQALKLWIDAYLSPDHGRAELIATLLRLVATTPGDEPSLSRLAGAAWLLDETALAIGLSRSALVELDSLGADASRAVMNSVLEWTLIDAGRWDAALEAAALSRSLSSGSRMKVVAGAADAATATVLAARGEHGTASRLASEALAGVRREQCSAVESRARYALGLSAFAAGHYSEAFGHFSRMFGEDGVPLHWHSSMTGIADLADAASRAGRAEDGRRLLRRIEDHLPPEPSARVTVLLARARGHLAPAPAAEAHFRSAVENPHASRWPFDHASARLAFAEWLRRQRRVTEARPLLEAAREAFRELGAQPWLDRAEGELRASSVNVPGIATAPESVTPQQWEIARLAAAGLSNREIGSRMFLSPRTVASHLYRVFPKLGVRDRAQLRDVFMARETRSTPGA
jgi:ATP/maltotriose-dependent transcriptional regulator MalT